MIGTTKRRQEMVQKAGIVLLIMAIVAVALTIT